MFMRLRGKTALVTGGARGIGAAICIAMANEGANVVVSDTRSDEGEAIVDTILHSGGSAIYTYQDVTSEEGWENVVPVILERFRSLDVVVNNAGIVKPGTIEDQSFDDWRLTMSVNLDGVFLGTRAAVRAMKQAGGAIINMSSIEGIVGNQFVPAYNASKGGVRLLTKSAALHCAKSGYKIRVNSLHPGYVGTALVQDALAELPAEFPAMTMSRIPMGRFGEVHEIAAAAIFLASEESSYMTGAELVIDGGYLA